MISSKLLAIMGLLFELFGALLLGAHVIGIGKLERIRKKLQTTKAEKTVQYLQENDPTKSERIHPLLRFGRLPTLIFDCFLIIFASTIFLITFSITYHLLKFPLFWSFVVAYFSPIIIVFYMDDLSYIIKEIKERKKDQPRSLWHIILKRFKYSRINNYFMGLLWPLMLLGIGLNLIHLAIELIFIGCITTFILLARFLKNLPGERFLGIAGIILLCVGFILQTMGIIRM